MHIQKMETRKSETSRLLLPTPNKRRSVRITNMTKSANKKPETVSTTRKLNKRNGAPLRQAFQSSSSSSSSSSDDEDEEEYVLHMNVGDQDCMEMDSECSEEIGEVFSDEIDRRSRKSSNLSCSGKENRLTRSLRRATEETPSKKISNALKNLNVTTPRRNLSRAKSPAKSETKITANVAKNIIASKRNHVFSSDEDSDDCSKRGRERPRKERITITIPASMINKKITPIVITKTPGGSLRTRRRLRRNSDLDSEIVNPLDSRSASTLQELASRLHLSKVPEKLPCREVESREIEKFIKEVIDPRKGESSAMYISGVPGTGKTATVRAVVNAMKKNKKNSRFIYVEVNAMIFNKTVFSEVYNGIQEEFIISKKGPKYKITSNAARSELNSMFKKEDQNRPPIVVLIDELDSLCNRKQDILYDIFEWTALPQSKVTIIGIANTLDFPERMLCQRNASRLDKRRLVFQPYTHEQIGEIVRARLVGSQLVEAKAVELVAKKVAMNTGDLRQALDFLCRAISVAVEAKSEKLDLKHVITAQNAVLEPLKYRIVKGLRLHQFTLFRAVESMTREHEEVIFANVYKHYCIICTEVSGIQPASDEFAYKLLLQLASSSLILLSKGDHGVMNRRVKLGMTSMEAEKAIKAAVEKHKSTYSV